VASIGLGGEGAFTYVLPKNVLRKFIVAADLRTQVGALLFGASPPDNPAVKEIRAIVFPPQTGTHAGVTLPRAPPPAHDALAGLQPLGWVHTQPAETPHLPPADAVAHARLAAALPGWGGGAPIVLTVAFTPGSASLAAYKLTPAGTEWAAGVLKDPAATAAVLSGAAAPGYAAGHAAKAPILLSDRFLGSVLAPAPDGVWNYNFQGDTAPYELMLVPAPLGFFAEAHRPLMFLNFAGGGEEAPPPVELREDPFAP